MAIADLALWERIQAYIPDDPASAFRFTDRLARENDWHPLYAQRVVEEYRRFMFLAATCDHPVTPSDQVDQAWHLHLAYTREYWDVFCGKVLGRSVHHGPTRGGRPESDKFGRWYERTLDAYRRAFDEEPPADIWPPASIRFGEDLAYRRVNVSRSWVIGKPRWWRRVTAGRRRGAAAGALVMGVPAATALATNPLDWYGPQFLMLFAASCGVSLLAAFWIRHRFRPQPRPLDAAGGGLAPQEAAFVEGGPGRTLEATLASLMHDLVIEVRKAPSGDPRFHLAKAPERSISPIADRVVAVLGASPEGMDLTGIKAVVGSELLHLEAELLRRGVVVTRSETLGVRLASTAPLVATLLFGLAKIGVGLSRDRPVGFLAVGCLVAAAVAGWLALTYPRASRDAWRVVAGLKRSRRKPGPVTSAVAVGSQDATAWAVALYGLTAMNLGPDEKAALLAQRQSYAHDGFVSGGCGTGSGGGGDGGGGDGGCGGCGGD